MTQNLEELTRRTVLRGFGGAALVEVLSACSVGSINSGEDSLSASIGSNQNDPILVDFKYHYRNPQGIDFHRGEGAELSSPTTGRVWFTKGAEENSPFYFTNAVSDLGDIIQLSGQKEQYGLPNDRFTPFTLVGPEGWNAPHSTKSHAHMHHYLPPWVKLFKKGGVDYTTSESKVTRRIGNPHRSSITGDMRTSIFDGDNSRFEQIVKGFMHDFYSIGEKYYDTLVGKVIIESRKEGVPFFGAVAAITKMYQHGIIKEPDLVIEFLSFLERLSNVNIGMYFPYRNQNLAGYRKPSEDPDNKQRWSKQEITNAYRVAADLFRQKRWVDAEAAYRRYQRMSPIWGIASNERDLGIVSQRLIKAGADPLKSVVHLSVADGIGDYLWEHKADLKSEYWRGVYRNAARSYKAMGMKEIEEYFLKISQGLAAVDDGLTVVAGPGPGLIHTKDYCATSCYASNNNSPTRNVNPMRTAFLSFLGR